MNLLGVEATITPLSAVDQNCTSLSASKAQNQDTIKKVLADVYHVESAVYWAAGVDLEAGLKVNWYHFSSVEVTYNLPTACLNYDKAGKIYTPVV